MTGEPPGINETHDPALRSWVESAHSGSTDFPIQNLPYGVFRPRGSDDRPRVGVAIGDQILDLLRAADMLLLNDLSNTVREAACAESLKPLMTLDAGAASRLRRHLGRILGADGWGGEEKLLVPMSDAALMLPSEIGDYTDFYASIFHATHVGSLFRPENPLLPNYKHVPIAYHGRRSSLVVSDTPVVRPSGQIKGADDRPTFGPTARLDYEAEIGFLMGRGNELGQPISIDDAEEHIFGICLVNDWSARDIQAWEYQPLGPFLSKSFATSLSPWVVTIEALAPFRAPAFSRPTSDPSPLPYLSSTDNERRGGIDLTVEVFLSSAQMRRTSLDAMRLSRGSFRDMYWTMAQMVAHHTSNGCNLRTADLLASGTVSGAEAGTEGCLLERTHHGPIELPSGEQRTFLADGDEVTIRGYCERSGYARIGFGECRGVIEPSRAARQA
jgi:fumarylacetoacetase